MSLWFENRWIFLEDCEATRAIYFLPNQPKKTPVPEMRLGNLRARLRWLVIFSSLPRLGLG